jgi:hypothetical protein
VTGREFDAVARRSSSRLVTISWRGRRSRFRITWLQKGLSLVNIICFTLSTDAAAAPGSASRDCRKDSHCCYYYICLK